MRRFLRPPFFFFNSFSHRRTDSSSFFLCCRVLADEYTGKFAAAAAAAARVQRRETPYSSSSVAISRSGVLIFVRRMKGNRSLASGCRVECVVLAFQATPPLPPLVNRLGSCADSGRFVTPRVSHEICAVVTCPPPPLFPALTSCLFRLGAEEPPTRTGAQLPLRSPPLPTASTLLRLPRCRGWTIVERRAVLCRLSSTCWRIGCWASRAKAPAPPSPPRHFVAMPNSPGCRMAWATK